MHHVAIEPFTKFDPVMESVIGLVVPAVAVVGEIEVTTGPVMVNVSAFEVTPLDASVTLIDALPAFASSAAVTVAEIDVEVLAVTANCVFVVPTFQFTTGEGVGKLVPVSVRLNEAWPAIADVALRVVSVGPGPIVNGWVLVGVPDAVLITPIWTVAEVVSRFTGMVAESRVPPI